MNLFVCYGLILRSSVGLYCTWTVLLDVPSDDSRGPWEAGTRVFLKSVFTFHATNFKILGGRSAFRQIIIICMYDVLHYTLLFVCLFLNLY